MSPRRPVVVWGNCQARPLATLIRPTLSTIGWDVLDLPPVHEIDEAGLAEVQGLLRTAAALITQPIRDEYRIPGCGSDQLAAFLPSDAQCVRIPVVYDTAAFPHQVIPHGADGARVDAPITDYHDLRLLVAAERGLSVAETLAWWPAPSPEAVVANATRSRDELRRREASLDVAASDLLDGPVMHTMNHPSNVVLAEVARRVLTALGAQPAVEVPEREFLGARRAIVEPAVTEALRWPSVDCPTWVVDRRAFALDELARAHLDFYATRADVVRDARQRFAERLDLLGL